MEKKRLILCADDFGMNPAIDAGIVQLAESQRLNATSCLVEGPTFRTSAPALSATTLQCGLHLNFTEPMGKPGLFMPVSRLIMRAYLRTLDPGAVRRQIARQLDIFQDTLGRAPHFVDGHQHVHQLPSIRDALLDELSDRYPRLPWLRYTETGALAGLPWRLRGKAKIIDLLGARQMARQARVRGAMLNRRFLGVYDFQGGTEGYQHLLGIWLRQARDGDLLMCHPASRLDRSDPLAAQRVAEFDVLAGAQTAQWFNDYGIDLQVSV